MKLCILWGERTRRRGNFYLKNWAQPPNQESLSFLWEENENFFSGGQKWKTLFGRCARSHTPVNDVLTADSWTRLFSFSTPKPYLYNTSTVNLYTCIKQAQINNAAKPWSGGAQVLRKGKVKTLENGGHILTPFQPTLKTMLTAHTQNLKSFMHVWGKKAQLLFMKIIGNWRFLRSHSHTFGVQKIPKFDIWW